MDPRAHRAAGQRRRGAAVVELAVVLPVFVLLVIGAIDVGRAIMVRHKLVEAARAACRLHAIQDEVTPQQVSDVIDKLMGDANLTGYSYTLDPASANDIVHLAPVSATVSIPYDDVSWLPTSWFLAGKTMSATCVMPGDTGELTATLGPSP
jgi:Flp pilus assembly protein TadG